jgi:ABC-type multidrug transport system fused ATPase/permease subunit
MNSPMGAFSFLGQDASVLKKKVKPGTARRTLAFAAPYSGLLALFLFIVILGAGIGIASPLAYGWGGVLVVRHELDLGTVVALVSYLARLYAPLLGLSNIQVSLMTALVSFERVFEVLDLPVTTMN